MTGIFTTTNITAMVTEATSVVTGNIAPILVVLGTFVGLGIVSKALNGARRGKVRIH